MWPLYQQYFPGELLIFYWDFRRIYSTDIHGSKDRPIYILNRLILSKLRNKLRSI